MDTTDWTDRQYVAAKLRWAMDQLASTASFLEQAGTDGHFWQGEAFDVRLVRTQIAAARRLITQAAAQLTSAQRNLAED